MANNILFQVTQKETDDDNVTSDEKSYTITTTFTEIIKGTASIESGTQYKTINFGEITTANTLRINSDQSITIRLNGGTQDIILSKDLIIQGTVTGLQIKNDSGSTATVKYEIYG